MWLRNCILCLILATDFAGAQTRPKRVAPVESSQAARFNGADTVGVAVLVGVGKYPRYSDLSELHYPAADVDSLAATLKSQRYLVLSLKDSDATKASVLNAIKKAGEAMSGENLTLVFFFSGHGFAVNGENYLATLDANASDLAASGLSVKAVANALEKTKATRRVMWIDACRDEPGKGVGEPRSFANLQASAGTRMLVSTKAGKVSYEDDELKQGMFSYYLVKGLRGEAAGSDGLVTFQDLASYVTLQVRARSLETGHVQIPYEAGEASGDFLLAHAVAEAAASKPALSPNPGNRQAAGRVELPIADAGIDPANFAAIHVIASRRQQKWSLTVNALSGGLRQRDTSLQVMVLDATDHLNALPVSKKTLAGATYANELLDELGKGVVVCYSAIDDSANGQAFRMTSWFATEVEGNRAKFVPVRPAVITPASDAPCQ